MIYFVSVHEYYLLSSGKGVVIPLRPGVKGANSAMQSIINTPSYTRPFSKVYLPCKNHLQCWNHKTISDLHHSKDGLPVHVFCHVSTLHDTQPHWHNRTALDHDACPERILLCTRSYEGTESTGLFYGTTCVFLFHPTLNKKLLLEFQYKII